MENITDKIIRLKKKKSKGWWHGLSGSFLASKHKRPWIQMPVPSKKKKKKQKLSHGISIAKKLNKKTQF
jgi:hypothetical protein